MSALAGELAIDLVTHDGAVTKVDIDSTRPQVADRLLTGRPAEAAVALVPQLFAVCGRAQGIAAELALAAARGDMHDEAARQTERVRRIETEIAQEYLWRALLDWPQAVGAPADAGVLAELRRALAVDPAGLHEATRASLRHVAEQAVFGGDAAAWFAQQHVSGFEIWIARGATAAARFVGAVQREGARHGAPRDADAVPLLPPTASEAQLRALGAALAADPAFAQRPSLDGRPAETGAVSRLATHPLVAALLATFGRSTMTRLAARIAELARIVAGIESASALCGRLALPATGGHRRGLGWVETARGLLLHLIELAPGAGDDRVAHYRVLAPTEWNFHPQGALPAGLLGVHTLGPAELRRRADWLVQALDPCVAYTLRIDGNGHA
jgi:hypothetical protein